MPRLHAFLIVLSIFSTSALAQVTVVPGDTLWGLAQRYNTTPAAILAANGLSGSDLFPGAVLKLPADALLPAETYTVQTGDTLYDIAAAFHMSIDELLAINHIDGAIIRPGDVLRTKVLQTAPPAPLVVTVAPGDSLWSVAEANGTSVAALKAANNLADETLDPGVALVVPGRYADPSSADRGGPAPPTIKVARGDTLWDIAKRYDTTVATLMSANELNSENLKAGQILRIVSSSDIVRATPTATPTPVAPVMLWPLHGLLTSKFGYRQLRISGSNFHTGLDIDGDTGDPVLSATAGVVTYSGWRSGYGNLVVVSSGNAEYYYGHALELLVSEGQAVAAGQLIALVGSTGRSTGSHLHFEIRVDGAPVDPLPLLEQYATH